MFIAHLPAGYLLSRWLQKNLRTKKFLWAGLVASIFPDIDMLYFYFIDDRQTLHHHYWTHIPIVWLTLWLFLTLIGLLYKNRSVIIGAAIIFSNIILHFILDSIAGGIRWLYPFVDKDFFLVAVPAAHDFWIWNFVFHWTFILEITLLICAFALLRRDRRVHNIFPKQASS